MYYLNLFSFSDSGWTWTIYLEIFGTHFSLLEYLKKSSLAGLRALQHFVLVDSSWVQQYVAYHQATVGLIASVWLQSTRP